jgi:hypothetical protein
MNGAIAASKQSPIVLQLAHPLTSGTAFEEVTKLFKGHELLSK